MVKIHTLVFLLFFLTKAIIFFTSLYFVSHHHGLLASTCKFISFMKSSHVAIFFMFNAVIIAILVGSSKPSERDHDQLFSLSVSPPPPPVYEEVDDIGKELANDESDENDESHGFSLLASLPSLVYEVEDKEEAGNDKAYDEDDDEDRDEYHGFDGYEEDNEGGCSEDEVDSDEDEEKQRDLERRVQEFIDKVYRKWGEELYNERLLCLPAAAPESPFSCSS
ncbi:hypothetical protein AAG906_009912 [Vitis piasezkii]